MSMKVAERKEIATAIRANAKAALLEADARGKWMLADAEARLAAVYKADDEAWADITAAARKYIAEADAAVAARCRQRGIPENLRPRLSEYWSSRGENMFKERRAELRRVAEAQVAAQVSKLKVKIARLEARQLTELVRTGLTSEEARAFVETVLKPDELLPPLASLELHSGEVILLPELVTEDTASRNGVTPAVTANRNDETPAVTASRYGCAFCGGPLTTRRSGSKYCKPACRVADHRRRLKADAGGK
jgi:hypothetical protein